MRELTSAEKVGQGQKDVIKRATPDRHYGMGGCGDDGYLRDGEVEGGMGGGTSHNKLIYGLLAACSLKGQETVMSGCRYGLGSRLPPVPALVLDIVRSLPFTFE